MLCRCFVLSVLLGLAGAGVVRAHRLEADYRILPGGRVQVESWFDTSAEAPRGAGVKVYAEDGRLLAEGRIDNAGRFVFSTSTATALKVIVSAGAGHRKELRIPAAELARAPALEPTAAIEEDENRLQGAHESRVAFRDLATGLVILLAIAAVALTMRKVRRRPALKREQGT